MTKVKICGLKKLEHALIATETGASFLGFVFVEGVRRKISPFDANELITGLKERYTGDFPKLVGLFANQASSYVNQVVSQCDLDIVQLCGDEGPEYWSSINCSIIKQVKMDSEGKGRDELSHIKSQVDDITEAGHTPLLDSYERGALGAEESFYFFYGRRERRPPLRRPIVSSRHVCRHELPAGLPALHASPAPL